MTMKRADREQLIDLLKKFVRSLKDDRAKETKRGTPDYRERTAHLESVEGALSLAEFEQDEMKRQPLDM